MEKNGNVRYESSIKIKTACSWSLKKLFLLRSLLMVCRKIAIVVWCLVLLPVAAVGYAATNCNGYTLLPAKYCKDPFTRCYSHNELQCVAPLTADRPNWIRPGCQYIGGAFHCDSLQSQDMHPCNYIVDCYWAGFFCAEGEVQAPPTYTTYYYSVPQCNPIGTE